MLPTTTTVMNHKRASRRLVLVSVNMPHLKQYRRAESQQFVYYADFPVSVGQLVLCPPTKLHPKWTKGVVVKLDPKHYHGYVKPVRAAGARKKR